MRRFLITVLFVPLAFAAAPAYAQAQPDEREVEEARWQQAFRDGMAVIVEDLNKGSFSRLVRAMDEDDILERIFGLRLIDQRVKRDFREDIEERDGFEKFIESGYATEAKDGIRARLLLVESRGKEGRAVVRFDMPSFQANYIDYELQLDDKETLVVVDWDDYLRGYRFTDRIGLMLVQGQPNVNAVRKLIDFPNVRERQVFQVMELLKAARDYDFERLFDIYDGLDEKLQGQRAVLIAALDASRNARKRRHQRRILVAIDRYFPEDPLFSVSLLDYYFPDRQYQKAYNALIRLKNELNIDDAVMSARLSSTTLVMGQLEDAIAYAGKAVQQEPALELGWWAVLRAEVAAGNHANAVLALDRLAGEFGHTLDPEALARDPSLKQFSRSAEYRDWHSASTTGNGG